jgi:hypothetical protein
VRAAILQIEGMSASSARDVWAVGTTNCASDNCRHELTVHWDGVHWRAIPAGSERRRCIEPGLYGVTALTPRNAWAIGGIEGITRGCDFILRHWDGHKWRSASLRGLPHNATLLAVDGSKPKRLLAAGATKIGHPLIVRWNGKAWISLPAPSLGKGFNSFTSVFSFAPNDIWGVINGSTIVRYACRR